jgi:hypothetical protein
MKCFYPLLALVFFTLSIPVTAQESTVGTCSVFADGPNETWVHALTVTTPDSANSGGLQTVVFDISSLPAEGANYRVVKTVANGNWNNGNAFALMEGTNTITVSAVTFDRSVKLQFSSGDISFTEFTINGNDGGCATSSEDGTPVADCSLFEAGPNETWPYALTVTTPDSANSAAAQSIQINVTALPADGANYRIVKTVANGNWNNGNAVALELGLNTIAVTEVTFDRSVKVQLSSGDIEFSSLSVNAMALTCASPSADGTAMADCSLFSDGPNETWPYAITLTTPDAGNSAAAQTLEINITALPAEGATYRVVKTVANGNWNNGNAMALSIGVNTITVSEVTFDRSVKIQFSSGAIEFTDVLVNSEVLTCAGPSDFGTAFADCGLFEDGPNETWTHVLTLTTPDSANSSAAQTAVIDVTALPEEGANYRVVKTVANGNWNNGNAMALALGSNTIGVTEVTFDRSVKLQFSSGAIEFATLEINGEAAVCPPPCEDLDDDGICDEEDDCVGALDALGVCNGDCSFDSDADGICDDVDDCIGALDVLGVCNGTCASDEDADGVCDDVDDCIGQYDECGICNGDGILPWACDCDGNVLDALGVCGGTCESDVNANGICDTEEAGASIYCGAGTTWDSATLQCVAESSCVGDLDNDGTRAVGDLLMMLGVFGSACD